jgi:hypothetical protein
MSRASRISAVACKNQKGVTPLGRNFVIRVTVPRIQGTLEEDRVDAGRDRVVGEAAKDCPACPSLPDRLRATQMENGQAFTPLPDRLRAFLLEENVTFSPLPDRLRAR